MEDGRQKNKNLLSRAMNRIHHQIKVTFRHSLLYILKSLFLIEIFRIICLKLSTYKNNLKK